MLELVDLRRGDAGRHWLPPFDEEIDFENDQWWDQTQHYFDSPWFIRVLEQGVEVARVELDDPGDVNPTYLGAPKLGAERLEIQLLEVAMDARGRGVGTRVVRLLQARHPARRMFAYSEQAQGFWASLGWERFDHPEGEDFHRPLFVQTEWSAHDSELPPCAREPS